MKLPEVAAEPGFEPGLGDSKSPVLPLHNSAFYITVFAWWCRRSGSNRHGSYPPTVFETVASAYSATPAEEDESDLATPMLCLFYAKIGDGARTEMESV